MSDPVLRAAAVLAHEVGLQVQPGLRSRLARCLHDAAARRDIAVADFVACLPRDESALQELLDHVTVQESSFFRDQPQFDALAAHVLPQLDDPVTIWSAGCANGQEAYSLAMVLHEAGRRAWRVQATDVSGGAVARTAAGRYSRRELRGVSEDRLHRHFVPVGGDWEVVPALRRGVRARRHNLAADPPPFAAGASTVVFCRNVLIYFRRQDVVRFLGRLAEWLPVGAPLFLGYSESLWHLTERFALERLGDAFVYRLAPAGEPSRDPGAAPAGARARAAPSTTQAPLARGRSATGTERTGSTAFARQLAEGEAATAAGDLVAASAAFRRAVVLDPDHPIAHLHLGLTLEARGDRREAYAAYAAARSALIRDRDRSVVAALEGFAPAELEALLDSKLAEMRSR